MTAALTLPSIKPAPCEFIEAVFVYGPQRCGAQTRRRVKTDQGIFHDCGQHKESA